MPKFRFQNRLYARGDFLLVILTFLVGTAVSFPLDMLFLQRPPYFTTWFDQGQYLKSAAAFLRGDLSADQHWYPLLYPLMLAPFAWLPPLLATRIPDLACYVLTYAGFRDVARHFGVTKWGAVLLFLPATIAYYHLGDNWIQPWTTTLSAALIWLSFAAAARIMALADDARWPTWAYVGTGLLLALIPLCRAADIVISGLIGLCLIKAMLIDRRLGREFGWLMLGVLTTLAAGIALHLAIYGPRLTDYMLLSKAFGANFAWLGWKSYILLIEPMPWYPDGTGLLTMLPWLPLGAAGLLLFAATGTRKALTLLLLLPMLAYMLVMLTYIDLLPSGLWRYGNSHYFKWILPMFALFGWLFVRQLPRRPAPSLLALAVVLLPASLHIMPRVAGPDEPARMVTFAEPKAPFADIYFARSVLIDKAGKQQNILDYHQVPDGKGLVMAQALRRDFTGDEVWHRSDRTMAWPLGLSGDPELVLPGPFPRRAIQRYRPTVSLGWPCWLPPYACPRSLPRAGPFTDAGTRNGGTGDN